MLTRYSLADGTRAYQPIQIPQWRRACLTGPTSGWMGQVSWCEVCESRRRQEQVAWMLNSRIRRARWWSELHKCLVALRCSKAPGCVSVPVEAYRGSVKATKELFRICRLVWHSERIPPELVHVMFVMLHKKGPRDDYRNYIAICLQCHSYKLMSAIVAWRLITTLADHLSDTLAGFRVAWTTSAPLGRLYRWFFGKAGRH